MKRNELIYENLQAQVLILKGSKEQERRLHIPMETIELPKKIVFWGEGTDCGTTTNMLALASYVTCHSRYRVAVTHMESHIQGFHNFFSGTVITLEALQGQADIIFIDCGKRMDEKAGRLLREADVMVVNLKQSPVAFDTFFLQHVRPSLNCIYLVGSYQTESNYNKKLIQQIYRIPERQIAVIPFNPEFEYACERGKLDIYMCGKTGGYVSEWRRYFMKELENAMRRILENMNE